MKCWRCLEEVSDEDPSCPHCGITFPPDNDEPRWKLEKNWLDGFCLLPIFAALFWPSVALIFLDYFTDISQKISGGGEWLRILIIAFAILCCANWSVKRGVLSGNLPPDIDREKSPTTFNLIINIQVLLSISLMIFSVKLILE